MEIKIIRSNQLQPIGWQGGITTQLFIFPENGDYPKRDFQFRLSTATVEVENPDFTSLPGFSRKLMVLDGEITLIHEDHHTAQLKKFDVDSFEGGWRTFCIGKCTDFNLMTAGETIGELFSIEIKKEERWDYKIKNNSDWFFVYVYGGSIEVNINSEISKLYKGDLLVLNKPKIHSFEMKGIKEAELVILEIEKTH